MNRMNRVGSFAVRGSTYVTMFTRFPAYYHHLWIDVQLDFVLFMRALPHPMELCMHLSRHSHTTFIDNVFVRAVPGDTGSTPTMP